MTDINQALLTLSQGLLDGGCGYTTCFPGFYSHDLAQLLGEKTIAINEKIAYEMAFGASLAGTRSVACMKNFGLNVAADPFLNSIITGVNAGLVLILTEDVEVEGSQGRQDSRYYRDFFGGLWFEPNSLQYAYNIAYHAFAWSEQLDIPIVIRLTNQFFRLEGTHVRQVAQKQQRSVANAPSKFVVHPGYWRKQRKQLQEKNRAIQKFVEKHYDKQQFEKSKKVGVIVFGNCQNEVVKHLDNDDLFPITTYPIPKLKIKNFIMTKTILNVYEQGNDYGKKMVSELLQDNHMNLTVKSHTGMIPNLEHRYYNWSQLDKLFKGLKAIVPSFVVGDVTQFTRETTQTIQACLCLGACISTGIGLSEAGVPYPFCISGDASLAHTGIRIINEAAARNAHLGIVIIDNGGSQSTGGQMPPYGLALNNLSIRCECVHYEKTDQVKFSEIFVRMRRTHQTMVLRVITD